MNSEYINYLALEVEQLKRDGSSLIHELFANPCDPIIGEKSQQTYIPETNANAYINLYKNNKLLNIVPINEKKSFWSIIKMFGWQNQFDKKISVDEIDKVIEKLSTDDRETLSLEISKLILKISLLPAYGIIKEKFLSEEDRSRAVFHIILLGKEWYENINDDPELLHFIIDQGGIQSSIYRAITFIRGIKNL